MDDDRELLTRESLTISPDLARRVQDELGQNVYLCYQCVKCTSGCPVSAFFDWQPNQIMRAVQLGQEDIVLNARTPWLCASCQTCTTRCPQGLDIAAIMEFLTREAKARGYRTPVPEVAIFNRAFMREVGLWGRSYEPGLMAEMTLRNLGRVSPFADIGLYVRMLKKRKVAFLPGFGRPPRRVKPVPGAARAIAYYPGCSLHSTSPEFNTSTKAVCEALDLELIEPEGWVCCGSSAAHRSDPAAAVRLPYENLVLFEQSGFDEVTMPCAACYSRHRFAVHEIRRDSRRRAEVEDATGLEYRDTVEVSTLADTLHRHVGVDRVAQRVRRPLEGLRVVCYYGCLLTRPPEVTGAPHPENPTEMDRLVAALGAEVVDWSYKTQCCGAAHSLTRPDIVLELSGSLIRHAREAGADVIAVACPLCHTNLDARQFQMGLDRPLPVLYFTQLMALAFDLPPKAAALDKNLVDPKPVLAEKGLLA
jgi:heterodisulfide reductase subunit B